MSDVLLTLVMAEETAQQVEDLLLAHPALASGFTTIQADGHGSRVRLRDEAELVSGHAPRLLIQIITSQPQVDAILALLAQTLGRANIHYWIVPVIASGVINS